MYLHPPIDFVCSAPQDPTYIPMTQRVFETLSFKSAIWYLLLERTRLTVSTQAQQVRESVCVKQPEILCVCVGGGEKDVEGLLKIYS